MAEPNFTSGPSIPSQEKAAINKEKIIANPALSGVAGHDVHARGEVASEGNFENVLKELNEFREELVGRFDKAKQEVEEMFTLHPETRTVTFEEESKSAKDLFQDLVQKLELIKGETLIEDRTERANEVVREIGESALEMEAIAEALEEYLYSQANVSAAEAQPTAQVIPFPSQSQPVGDTRAPEVNMSGTDNTSHTPADSNGAQGSGENGQGNKDGRKGGSGNGGDGGDGDDPKSGASIGDRSKAALLQAKAGARVIPEVLSNEEPSQQISEKRRREMTDYTLADRNEVEEWIQTRNHRYKLVKINDALKDFGYVCKEISFLHGWQLLEQSIKDLPEKELADEVRRKKKFSWLDGQFDSFGNDERKQELEAPEKLDELYMQLHDLLVASQKVLFELQQSQTTGQSVGNEGEVPERRILFAERLERIYALAEEWKQLGGQFGQGPKQFSEAVAKELGQERIMNVKRFIDELEEQGKQHGWKGEPSKGDKSAAVKKLSFLEAQVAAARKVVSVEVAKSSQGSTSASTVEPTSSVPGSVDPLTALPVTDAHVPEILDDRTMAGQGASVANERRQKQLERNAERLEVLQDIRIRFHELYNDFQLSEDRPTDRQSYERYGKGAQAVAGKIILPPLDEDESVVANPRELLKQGIHDIYAEFLLTATPEKFQESAYGKGVEGKHRFEAYKNRLMNLYNKLWAQLEAVHEIERGKSNTSTNQSNQLEQDPQKAKEEMTEVHQAFEKELMAKVQEFVQDMDMELQQQGKDYAYRFGAISSHMSMVVDTLTEALRGDLVLSEAERKSMIKKSISSIEIAD